MQESLKLVVLSRRKLTMSGSLLSCSVQYVVSENVVEQGCGPILVSSAQTYLSSPCATLL